eukprot:TRINITY_DN9202_c1_g1_i1.p1 TRINITY_DN9202_c1_g1~~TRINITY_DN9202_c1_g1_i1.p1  ORF type:complete len:381 (+),score=17.98 TRINITY_DN9202_c1_g1_i1:64-1143(+)
MTECPKTPAQSFDVETPCLLEKSSDGPPAILVHGAIAVAYMMFGGGAVVSKFALASVSPITFEFYREVISGVILIAGTVAFGRQVTIAVKDFGTVMLAAACLYGNQVLFFVGLQFTEAVVASLWTATLPVFVTVLSVLCGRERLALTQSTGIVITVVGALIIPFSGSHEASVDPVSHKDMWVVGNCMLCGCITCCSSFIVISGRLTKIYPSTAVTGWCFLISSVLFSITAKIVYDVPQLLESVCMGHLDCMAYPWHITSSVHFCLAYEVVMCTMVAWSLLTWSTRYAKPSVSSIYTAMQPLTTGLISWVLCQIMTSEWISRYSIQEPGWTHVVAAALIACGLVIAFSGKGTWRDETPTK